jgi:hypothetical protein
MMGKEILNVIHHRQNPSDPVKAMFLGLTPVLRIRIKEE